VSLQAGRVIHKCNAELLRFQQYGTALNTISALHPSWNIFAIESGEERIQTMCLKLLLIHQSILSTVDSGAQEPPFSAGPSSHTISFPTASKVRTTDYKRIAFPPNFYHIPI
jgi:hypothetical protein